MRVTLSFWRLRPDAIPGKPGEPRPGFPVVKRTLRDSEKPAGEWNEANIYVKDGKINVYINGVYQNTGMEQAERRLYRLAERR